MKEAIFTVLRFVALLALIIVSFKFYKSHNKAVIDTNDHSMDPEYTYGNYSLETIDWPRTDLEAGAVVAYFLPGQSGSHRVGRVIAKAGQRISIAKNQVLVNGVRSTVQPSSKKTLSEIVVPQGCVFIMAALPEEDSLKYGPIPLRNLKGRIK